MNVRRATPADAETISTLTLDVHTLYVTAQPELYKPITDPHFAVPTILERIADGKSRYYLVSVDGETVGYAHARLYERLETPYTLAMRYLYVEEISVRPAFRRLGCGEALMAAVRDLARELGVSQIRLDHGAFNTGAHAFFVEQGFVSYGERMWLWVTL